MTKYTLVDEVFLYKAIEVSDAAFVNYIADCGITLHSDKLIELLTERGQQFIIDTIDRIIDHVIVYDRQEHVIASLASWAVTNGCTKLVRKLVCLCMDRTDLLSPFVVQHLIMIDDVELLRLLIKSISIDTENYDTVMFNAMKNNNIPVIKLLLNTYATISSFHVWHAVTASMKYISIEIFQSLMQDKRFSNEVEPFLNVSTGHVIDVICSDGRLDILNMLLNSDIVIYDYNYMVERVLDRKHVSQEIIDTLIRDKRFDLLVRDEIIVIDMFRVVVRLGLLTKHANKVLSPDCWLYKYKNHPDLKKHNITFDESDPLSMEYHSMVIYLFS